MEKPIEETGLDCLSYSGVIAQSIAVIAPSTIPAAVLGLIFVSAGNGPGLVFLSTLCGFAIFGQMLLAHLGIHLPILVLFAFGVIVFYGVAYKDIKLSAKMMLIFEGISILSILLLGVIIWAHKGFAIDAAQVTLQSVTPGGVITGIVLVVFGFSGFESSTSLGDEAKDPLRTIPRSLLQSTAVSGLFFLFMAYVIVQGFKGSGADLGKSEAPLAFLAPLTGLGFLGTLINIGALLSFFSCTLACINSTARIVFSMARHGLPASSPWHDAVG